MSNKRDAPINIETSINTNPERSCISTCQYSFQYNNSSCNVYHEGEFFRIPYDAASGSYPANFKGTDYRVDSIRIYQPSLHSLHLRQHFSQKLCVPVFSRYRVVKCMLDRHWE